MQRMNEAIREAPVLLTNSDQKHRNDDFNTENVLWFNILWTLLWKFCLLQLYCIVTTEWNCIFHTMPICYLSSSLRLCIRWAYVVIDIDFHDDFISDLTSWAVTVGWVDLALKVGSFHYTYIKIECVFILLR